MVDSKLCKIARPLVSKVEPEALIAENFEFEIMLQIKHHKISELKAPMPIEACKSPPLYCFILFYCLVR